MGILTTQRNSAKAGGLLEFTQGIEADSRLATQEVQVQKAWARALARIGVLSPAEGEQVVGALEEARKALVAGTFEWRVEDEDVHMNLERFVTERLGVLGKKMHLGRSRNDLIATSLRLYVRDSLSEASDQLAELVAALCESAEKHLDVLIPGMTHLQHGQPVRFGHVLAGHAWGFQRDRERLADAAKRAMAAMPLGSAALAGTTLDIDLQAIARELGFARPPRNSYDAVGDRDFVMEGLDALSSAAVHLSRISEDLIYWSSTGIGLVKLPRAWSTGSSIMPNKRNPDVPELIRGKSAHVMSASVDAHALLKAVATSYGSDLHEIKQVFIRSWDELRSCLSVLPPFIREMGCDPAEAERLLGRGHILATEVADHLAAQGVPFREAYAQVAALVERAESARVQIERLPVEAWKELAPKADLGFVRALSPESAIERRRGPGGTARAGVLAQLAELRECSKNRGTLCSSGD